jgi:hypothetical protein
LPLTLEIEAGTGGWQFSGFTPDMDDGTWFVSEVEIRLGKSGSYTTVEFQRNFSEDASTDTSTGTKPSAAKANKDNADASYQGKGLTDQLNEDNSQGGDDNTRLSNGD